MIYQKYKYISVIYNNTDVLSVAEMMREHYDIPKYEDTVFLLNASYDEDKKVAITKNMFTEKHIIYYNLEHYEVSVTFDFFKDFFIDWITNFGFDEIWDFAIENIEYLPIELQKITKFIPMRYTQALYDEPIDCPKKYDLGFVGVISMARHMHRVNIFNDIQYIHEMYNKENKHYRNVSFKIIKGGPIKDLKDELSSCRYLFDCLNNKKTNTIICSQNQVRIFECIMRGYNVISEKVNGINYFPDMIYQFSFPADNERKDGYCYGVELIEYLDQPYNDKHIENREKYKQMTYKDEDFENYKRNIRYQYSIIKQEFK